MMTALVTQFGNIIANELLKRTKSLTQEPLQPEKQTNTPTIKETLQVVGFKRNKSGYTAIYDRGMAHTTGGYFPNNF